MYIEKLVYGGYGLGRDSEGMIIFVENAYPGEIVDVILKKVKRDYSIGRVVRFRLRSTNRLKPECDHFKECGGCCWMDYPYEEQLKAKKEIVSEQFRRFLKLDPEPFIREVERSDVIFRYRNKLIFKAFFDNGEMNFGFVGNEGYTKISDCKVAPRIFSDIKNYVGRILNAIDPEVFRGTVRNLGFRMNEEGDLAVLFVSRSERIPNEGEVLKLLLRKFPDLQIVFVHNARSKSAFSGKVRVVRGDGYLIERMNWFEYMIPVESFFQVNKNITMKMLGKITEILCPSKREKLLDLYCGVGIFGIYFSPLFSKVVGVDLNERAIKFARANTKMNKVKNCVFLRDDAVNFLRKAVRKKEKFDKIILDPPRGGIGREGMELIAELKPKRIIYISCNPSTLVRDLKVLLEKGYEIVEVQPFDMFPHTYHVETVALLDRGEGMK